MNTEQAMMIVLKLVKSPHIPLYVREREKEAIEEVENYLKTSALMDEPATGCNYGIGVK